MALVGEAKAKSKARKATVNYDELLYDIDTYLRTNGNEYWRELFIPLIQGVVADQGQEWASVLGMQFDVRNLEGEQWFQDYVLQFAQPINQTTSDGVHSVIAQGMEEGWAIPTMQEHLEQLFTQWQTGATGDEWDWYEQRKPPRRTELIARTETLHASNAGSYNLMRQWNVTYKAWLATLDGRERDSHRAATFQYDVGGVPGVIPMGQAFIVGGHPMMYPLDGSMGAPISEIANCRCTTLPYNELPTVGADTDYRQFGGIQSRIADMYSQDGRQNARDDIANTLEVQRERNRAIMDEKQANMMEQDALHAKRDILFREMEGYNINSDEWQRRYREYDAIDERLWQLSAKYNRLKEEQQGLFKKYAHTTLSFGDDAGVQFQTRVRGDRVGKAAEFLSDMINPDAYGDELAATKILATTRSRAYAHKDIYLTSHNGANVIIHEWGHILEERSPSVHQACIDFLDYRTQGESSQPLRGLLPNQGYDANEIAKPDRFKSPYSGKIYVNPLTKKVYATEILSMGLQYLYEDPERFATEDPEYFDFIIGIARGWL